MANIIAMKLMARTSNSPTSVLVSGGSWGLQRLLITRSLWVSTGVSVGVVHEGDFLL